MRRNNNNIKREKQANYLNNKKRNQKNKFEYEKQHDNFPPLHKINALSEKAILIIVIKLMMLNISNLLLSEKIHEPRSW